MATGSERQRKGPKPKTPCRYCATCNRHLEHHTKGDECRQCLKARAATTKVCPFCQGPKDRYATCCKACMLSKSNRAQAKAWRWVVADFDADGFRRVMAERGWTVELLAEISGVSGHAIWEWLRGAAKPRRTTFGRIVRAMAMDRCESCAGVGYVDGGIPARLAILEAVTSRGREVA